MCVECDKVRDELCNRMWRLECELEDALERREYDGIAEKWRALKLARHEAGFPDRMS